ncbi:MAG TPA: sigma-70 family RNA polymerase sigma factor [Actinomycetota bacterium]|nr:sigma-70 family RNA polymerase sigma factor [Actinomycetota bacterium]
MCVPRLEDEEGSLVDELDIREFLVTAYPRLVAAVALVSGSRPAAEDAVQEALVRAWVRSERGERIESLPAWVAAVALNLARSGVRRRIAERRARARLSHAERVDVALAGARVDIERALDSLPRRQREVVVLRYYLEMDTREVATILHIHEGTVKSTLFRARAALAATLGVTETEEAEDHGTP